MVRYYVLVAALLTSAELKAAEWPEFRGPMGQGHATASGLPVRWGESDNVAWRAELPGRGWSSPVVEGNKIWMTTAVESAPAPDNKQRLGETTNDQPLTVSGKLSMRALCVDRTSGQLIANLEVLTEASPDPIHSLNSFASPTPVIEDGKLYCHFGANGTACVGTRGSEFRVLWVNKDFRIKHENGAGSSPVLWENWLIFHCDGSDEQYIVALDKYTGRLGWKTKRSGTLRSDPQLRKAYGTPLIIDVNGQPQLVSPAADWLYGYDPRTGEELWKLSYGVLGFSIVPRPVANRDMVFFSTTFMQSELLAVKFNGSIPEIAWRYKKQVPQMPSPLLVGDELYMVSDKGIATCLDAKTGDVHWTERLGGNFCSSPLLADGRIYVGNREGSTFVLAPSTKYQLLATNELDGQIMASPIALDRALFIRTDKALYRLEKKL